MVVFEAPRFGASQGKLRKFGFSADRALAEYIYMAFLGAEDIMA